ncbi:CPCC family cysteine-rich protein, partial [Aeromonas hydrophila]
MKYTCPCWGYKTLDEPAIGTFDICEFCGWEDDLVQNSDPDYEGGANVREGANKRGNSSRLTQSFHFFMFEPIFSPVNAL